jgi:hypothetical protein
MNASPFDPVLARLAPDGVGATFFSIIGYELVKLPVEHPFIHADYRNDNVT